MTAMLKVGQSGRAMFNDMPSGVAAVDPVAHIAASLIAGGAGLEEGECVVGHYPPGATYRLIVDTTGARVVRRDPETKTADAGLRTVADIQAANERFWARPQK